MDLFEDPKIDCHAHVLDPVRFPYDPQASYRPEGQEIAPAGHFMQVMQSYGVRHALLVQPNSGYGSDNSCLLDAIERGEGRFQGIAIVRMDVSTAELRGLQVRGIVGAAVNATFHGTEYYKNADGLMKRLADLDMFLDLQTEQEQLLTFAPWIESIPVRVLIDHLGRPPVAGGLVNPGFSALLRLADTERVTVKISGYAKFSRDPYPFEDCWPFVRAIADAFTLNRCVWASDWPFLRSTERQDYGPLLNIAARLFPDAADRRKLFWHTPQRLFGFSGTETAA
jgi:predicted TIM-barrel fold metal-dependent hydrolase